VARTFWAKSIGLPISDFEFQISDILRVLFFNPHSAIPIPKFRRPSVIDFLQGMMYKGGVVEKRREKKGGFLWAVVFQEGIF
jgi:hypothetical protein